MLAPKSLSSPQNAAITAGGTPNSFSARANAGGMGFDFGLALLHPVHRRHPRRELRKHLPEHALAAVPVDDTLVVDEVGDASANARCDTPAATACCLRSARKRSNDMPLWQAAPPRGAAAATGAAAGLAGAAVGLGEAPAGWADTCCGPHSSASKAAPTRIRVIEGFRMRLPIDGVCFLGRMKMERMVANDEATRWVSSQGTIFVPPAARGSRNVTVVPEPTWLSM